MKSKFNKKFVCIDVGSSKVCSSIATIKNKEIRIIDFQTSKCDGISKGVIKNLSLVEKYISESVEKLEKKTGESIKSAFVNISSRDLNYTKIRSSIDLPKRPIQQKEIDKLLSFVDFSKIKDYTVLHVIPISYTLDDVKGIKDPIGMVGNVLSFEAIVIYVPSTIFKNLMFAFERSHIDVNAVVASPLASGLGVLTSDEMNNGTILVDIGGTLSTVACFNGGVIQEFKVFPFGGENITKDISYALDISFQDAERLKNLYGKVFKSIIDDKEFVLIPKENEDLVNLKQVPKSEVIRAIEPRVSEMFEIMNNYVKNFHYPNIVITGYTTLMPGCVDIARLIFKKQIKKTNLDIERFPSAVNLGIMNFVNMYGMKEQEKEREHENDNVFCTIKKWINDNL